MEDKRRKIEKMSSLYGERGEDHTQQSLES